MLWFLLLKWSVNVSNFMKLNNMSFVSCMPTFNGSQQAGHFLCVFISIFNANKLCKVCSWRVLWKFWKQLSARNGSGDYFYLK